MKLLKRIVSLLVILGGIYLTVRSRSLFRYVFAAILTWLLADHSYQKYKDYKKSKSMWDFTEIFEDIILIVINIVLVIITRT